MAGVQVLKLQTSAHKEVSVGGCTDPTKTPQSENCVVSEVGVY